MILSLMLAKSCVQDVVEPISHPQKLSILGVIITDSSLIGLPFKWPLLDLPG